ncbi:hypothetical protein ACKKBF_B17780 [Auxenochlorella protothecoides x Auxenochlorella symbiontica]
MIRSAGMTWVDRWLRRRSNRALLAAVVLLPCLIYLNSAVLPEVPQQAVGEVDPGETHTENVEDHGANRNAERAQDRGALQGQTPITLAREADEAGPSMLAKSPPPAPSPSPRQRTWPPLPPPPPPSPPPAGDPPPGSLPFLLPRCADGNAQCDAWHGMGECVRNPGYMYYNCPRSCLVCNVTYLDTVPEQVEIAPGVWMPTVGFGTAGLGDATAEAVASALANGYRLLDSAQAREWYREDLVGEGLAASGVPRSQVFLTSKLHPRNLGYWNTLSMVRQSLADLRTDYLDLFLLHYPDCGAGLCPGLNPEGTWQDSWAALEELAAEGLVRAIGVANFDVVQLEALRLAARTPPALVQTGMEPRDPGAAVRAWCRRHGVRHQAYSSLGTQRGAAALLSHPVVRGVAAAHADAGATPAQVLLAWALRHGSAVVPRSASPAHQRENLAAARLALSAAEMQDLDGLDGA